jgi:hypothetical protein
MPNETVQRTAWQHHVEDPEVHGNLRARQRTAAEVAQPPTRHWAVHLFYLVGRGYPSAAAFTQYAHLFTPRDTKESRAAWLGHVTAEYVSLVADRKALAHEAEFGDGTQDLMAHLDGRDYDEKYASFVVPAHFPDDCRRLADGRSVQPDHHCCSLSHIEISIISIQSD